MTMMSTSCAVGGSGVCCCFYNCVQLQAGLVNGDRDHYRHPPSPPAASCPLIPPAAAAAAPAPPSTRLTWRSEELLCVKSPPLTDPTVRRLHTRKSRVGFRPIRAAGEEANALLAAPVPSKDDDTDLKLQLLSVVVGLDRGLLAGESDVQAVDEMAKGLEDQLRSKELGCSLEEQQEELLQGRWRLIYSSAFATRRSLGGMRPGPPLSRQSPFTLGNVYQRIDVVSRELDNVVELQIALAWPLPTVAVEATLAHSFEFIGNSQIKITFQKTSAKIISSGLSQIPPVQLPQLPEFLRPPTSLRSGIFQVTYLDRSLRISRGDRGELRIFLTC